MSRRFPLSFQTVLPDDYRNDKPFRSLLDTLRQLGFWGVELNLSDPDAFDPGAVREFLGAFRLELSMLASGLTAKKLGLSLSSPDEGIRRRSVEKCRQMIDWVGGSQAGVILGFLKGGVAPDPKAARERFAGSLAEVLPRARESSVPVLVEATNRYESSVANSLEDAAVLLQGHDPRWAQMLPDTFHMNIEEIDLCGSLARHKVRYSSVHLSDNTRHFPGLGGMDFGRVITCLDGIGYRGRLAIEGNVRNDVESDLHSSVAHLAPLLEE